MLLFSPGSTRDERTLLGTISNSAYLKAVRRYPEPRVMLHGKPGSDVGAVVTVTACIDSGCCLKGMSVEEYNW